jgi:hypothetical protein
MTSQKGGGNEIQALLAFYLLSDKTGLTTVTGRRLSALAFGEA